MICDDSRDFLSPLRTVIKKPIHAGGGGVSSKMNVPRLSAVELILQHVNVERPWLFDLEKFGSSPSAKPPARSY